MAPDTDRLIWDPPGTTRRHLAERGTTVQAFSQPGPNRSPAHRLLPSPWRSLRAVRCSRQPVGGCRSAASFCAVSKRQIADSRSPAPTPVDFIMRVVWECRSGAHSPERSGRMIPSRSGRGSGCWRSPRAADSGGSGCRGSRSLLALARSCLEEGSGVEQQTEHTREFESHPGVGDRIIVE